MKKILAILSIILLVSCSKERANKFSVELEKANMNEYIFLSDNDHAFLDLSIDNFKEFINQKASGIIYFGSSSCPWCNRIVPVLNEVAKEENAKIYYVNCNADDFDEEAYYYVYSYLYKILKEYDGNKELYLPEVVSIRNGEIVNHRLSAVDSYTNFNYDFTDEQKKELKNIYKKLINDIK